MNFILRKRSSLYRLKNNPDSIDNESDQDSNINEGIQITKTPENEFLENLMDYFNTGTQMVNC
jgi:hypothetical protein